MRNAPFGLTPAANGDVDVTPRVAEAATDAVSTT
jgi:hypothetical protein